MSVTKGFQRFLHHFCTRTVSGAYLPANETFIRLYAESFRSFFPFGAKKVAREQPTDITKDSLLTLNLHLIPAKNIIINMFSQRLWLVLSSTHLAELPPKIHLTQRIMP